MSDQVSDIPREPRWSQSSEAILGKCALPPQEGSSLSWLITFADLMTILLVFSFVLFMSHPSRQSSERRSRSARETESFLPLAFATTAEEHGQVTIDLSRTSLPPPESRRADTIIQRIRVFMHETTEPHSAMERRDLQTLADLYRSNPGSRIVLCPPAEPPDSPSPAQLHNLMSYMITACEIAPDEIFIQDSTAPQHTDTPAEPRPAEIEVRLTKPYWWF